MRGFRMLNAATTIETEAEKFYHGSRYFMPGYALLSSTLRFHSVYNTRYPWTSLRSFFAIKELSCAVTEC